MRLRGVRGRDAELPHIVDRVPARQARRLGAALAIAAVVLLIAITAPALVGRRESTYLAVYSAIFLGAVPLHLWLATETWRRESEGYGSASASTPIR